MNLELRRQLCCKLYELVVEKWNPQFQRVSHAHTVSFEHQIVRQPGIEIDIGHASKRGERLATAVYLAKTTIWIVNRLKVRQQSGNFLYGKDHGCTVPRLEWKTEH